MVKNDRSRFIKNILNSFSLKSDNLITNLFCFVKVLYKKSLKDDIPALGAQITYYLILAFFPFLVFLLAVLNYTPFNGEDILKGFSKLLPDVAYSLLEEAISQTSSIKSKALPSFSMLATIWAASRGVSAYIKGINKAYGRKESRGFLRISFISLIFTLGIALVLVFAFFMLVLGETLWQIAYNCFGFPILLKEGWNILRHVLPLSVMFIILSMAYMYIPNQRTVLKETFPGALFSTLGLVLISLIFSYCVNNYELYTNTYGSIAGVIILLIWLYWASIIILLGSEINAIMSYNKL